MGILAGEATLLFCLVFSRYQLSILKGWMDDLRVYVLFSVQYLGHIRTMRVDNERLCAMEPRLQLRRFPLERGSNSGPLDQQASA